MNAQTFDKRRNTVDLFRSFNQAPIKNQGFVTPKPYNKVGAKWGSMDNTIFKSSQNIGATTLSSTVRKDHVRSSYYKMSDKRSSVISVSDMWPLYESPKKTKPVKSKKSKTGYSKYLESKLWSTPSKWQLRNKISTISALKSSIISSSNKKKGFNKSSIMSSRKSPATNNLRRSSVAVSQWLNHINVVADERDEDEASVEEAQCDDVDEFSEGEKQAEDTVMDLSPIQPP